MKLGEVSRVRFTRSGRLDIRTFEVFVEEVGLMEVLFGAKSSATCDFSGADGCQVDSFVQNRWRSEWHRNMHWPSSFRRSLRLSAPRSSAHAHQLVSGTSLRAATHVDPQADLLS